MSVKMGTRRCCGGSGGVMRSSELMRSCANVSALDSGRIESDLQAMGGISPAEKIIIKGGKSVPFTLRLLSFPSPPPPSSLEGDLVLPLGANCSTHQLLAVDQHARSQQASPSLPPARGGGRHKQEVNRRRNLRGGRSRFLGCRRRCSSTSQQEHA